MVDKAEAEIMVVLVKETEDAQKRRPKYFELITIENIKHVRVLLKISPTDTVMKAMNEGLLDICCALSRSLAPSLSATEKATH
jgi:hypothetical protein